MTKPLDPNEYEVANGPDGPMVFKTDKFIISQGKAVPPMQPKQPRQPEPDTLPQWLHWRFSESSFPWENLDVGDQLKWVHEADAVRRAVARNGFKNPQSSNEGNPV